MLMNNEQKNMVYAMRTRQLRIDSNKDFLFSLALRFNKTCEHEQAKIPQMQSI